MQCYQIRPFRLLVVGMLLTLLSGSAWAQFEPPTRSNRSGKFNTTRESGKAEGSYRLSRSRLKLEADGLRPGGIYTVKFIKVRPFTSRGVGPRPHSFTADQSGHGSFTARLGKDAADWQLLLVHYHPNGDPSDAKTAKPILQAKLE